MALTAIASLRSGRPDMTTDAGRLTYLKRVGGAYRAWHRCGPPDIGGTTRAALQISSLHGGWRSWAGNAQAAGNGSLMRATAAFSAGS
jgi:hypothetical protein